MKLRARIAERVSAWARRRQGEDALPLQLRSRRLYILPTKFGLVAAVFLFLMLLAGLNYTNSLALLLTFLLAGFALVAMYDCHRNLAGLLLLRAQALPSFAQERGELVLSFENIDRSARRRLSLQCGETPRTLFDLEAGGICEQRVLYAAVQRGLQRIDRVELSTTAPLGLFRAWTWLHLPLSALIYPRPLHARPLPPPLHEMRSDSNRRIAGADYEWAWLRAFRPGDSPRRVAWKAYARGAPLLVAQYDAPAGRTRVLDFDTLQGMELEQRLSQLTGWVLECDRHADAYGLHLGAESVAVRGGAAQREACLEALALFGYETEPRAAAR